MRTIRKTGVTALTAGIALALGAVPVALTVPSILASSESVTTLTPSAVGEVSAGEVVLSTTTDKGIIKYGGLEQTFTGGQQCEVTPGSGSDPLLKITGSIGEGQPGRAGFDKGYIGVFETSDGSSGPINASQCSRVDAGSFTTTESLNIRLDPAGPYSDAPFSDRLLVGSATVDAKVANTRSGTITIGFLDADGKLIKDSDGEPITKPAPWSNKKTGSTIGIPDLSAALIPELALAGGFSGLSLTAKDGAFTLQGATFNLVSQAEETFCNPGNPTGGKSTSMDGVTEVRYLGNADESNSCFGVKLTGGATEFQWLKPLTISTDAQFVFDQVWSLPTPGNPDYALPKAYINFELSYPGATPEAPRIPSSDHEMLFCPEWLYTDGSLQLVKKTDSYRWPLLTAQAMDMEPDVSDVPGSTGTQFACIDKKSRETKITQGDNGLKVTDRIFLIGDARMRLG